MVQGSIKSKVMNIQDAYTEEHWDEVKNHVDQDGWFPDTILGDSIWVLRWCTRELRSDGIIYWRSQKLE